MCMCMCMHAHACKPKGLWRLPKQAVRVWLSASWGCVLTRCQACRPHGVTLPLCDCAQSLLSPLNPTSSCTVLQAGAGNALCDLLSARAAAAAAAAASAADSSSSAATAAAAAAENQLALEGQLLEELLVRAPDAHWATARLAGLQLQLRQYDAAVSSYQAAIRWAGAAVAVCPCSAAALRALCAAAGRGGLWFCTAAAAFGLVFSSTVRREIC